MIDLKKSLIVAKFTVREVLQSKILINVLFLGLCLLALTFVAFSFTYGTPHRVALDFGLGTLSLSAVGISIFIGISLISNEIESRTLYMVLSRPISRQSFFVGKTLGLAAVIVINTLILACITMSIFVLTGGQITSLIINTIAFIIIEAILMLSIVVLLSLLTNKVLTVIIALSLYIVGHSISTTQLTSMVQNSDFLQSVLEIYHFILPGFYKLNLKNYVLYSDKVDLSFIPYSYIYGAMYILSINFLSIYIFRRKNFD
ncbi:MAG: ABC transporter permease [Bacteriovoracaceae bacterium]|jgi:ABC-type transport system involved in multi-copper enzyme maturation permease subunit|nr:ABC transporter permease [Bacteriovoracaceae bacterium]